MVIDSWEQRFRERLSKLAPGILDDPVGAFAKLAPEQQDALLRSLLAYSCYAQSMRPLTRGPEVIRSLPRQWVLDNIERVFLLGDEDRDSIYDDYAYTRKLELYKSLGDDALLSRAIAEGLKSENGDIREIALDWETP